MSLTNSSKAGARVLCYYCGRDCMVRAFFLAAGHIDYARYQEATKGEKAALCDNDLFELDLNRLDPVAVIQNFSCEVERIMGIYPNVPELKYVGPPSSEV